MLIGHDAAGAPDRFHGCVVFANSPEHSGDAGDAALPRGLVEFVPDFGIFAEWIERNLQSRDADLLDFREEGFRRVGLKRPTTDSEFVCEGHNYFNAT